MSKLFGFADLWPVMQAMYPEVEDEREDDDDYEHPMTAVGLILLSAALLQTIEPSRLRKKGCRDIDSVQAPRFYDLGKDYATKFSIDSCKIYWDERSRPAWRNR